MSSFKSTDIPYSQLCQAADEDHEFINLEELNQCHLNELDALTQTSGYDLPNQSLTTTHTPISIANAIAATAPTASGNLNSNNSPQRDSQQYHGHAYSQIMYQTVPQQAQYDQQLPTDESVLSQPYSPLNQNHYHYYPRNDQNTDPDLHLYHSQMYPQQPMQNQFYYHINPLSNYNENLNRCKKHMQSCKHTQFLIYFFRRHFFFSFSVRCGGKTFSESTYYTVLGNGTSYSLPTSNEAPPSETHSTQSAVQPSTYSSNPRKRKAYSTT